MSIITDLASGASSGIFTGINGILDTVVGAITGKTPLTPEAQAALLKQADDLQLASLQADEAIAAGQADINKIDAASRNPVQALWRPCVGWVCVLGLLYQFLICPMAPWLLKTGALLFGHAGVLGQIPELPPLDQSTLMPLLFGVLGLGGMRTFEKVKGAAK
jgi:hypothetical protein